MTNFVEKLLNRWDGLPQPFKAVLLPVCWVFVFIGIVSELIYKKG